MESLEQVVATNDECGGEIFELHDVLANDQEDPATKAARKMDWESMMQALTPRDQAVIECMVEGRSLRGVARRFRVSDSTIQLAKGKLALKIQDFMGYKILVDIQRQPKWKDNLVASKEQLACKHDRCH